MVVDHHVGAKKWTWASVGTTNVLKHWAISQARDLLAV